jgi:Gpi18-like mannosyltransferase
MGQKSKSINENINNKKSAFKISIRILLVILIAVTALRMVFSLFPCYKIDMGGYRYWAEFLAENSFKDFYKNTHCVYGPFYMYFLFITGKVFGATEFFVKFWSVLSDVGGGVLIYLIARKYKKEKLGIILGIIYAFNPAVVFNSSVWGQFDSFIATMLLAVVFLFNCKKTYWAVFVYAIAALTKPQSIAIFPMVVFLYFKDFPWKKFIEFKNSREKAVLKSAAFETVKKLALTIVGCMLIYAIIVLPFYRETSFYFLKDMEVYGSTDTAANLAQNKEFKASGEESAKYIAKNASDMDENTAWSSEHATAQWIYADLGSVTEIDRIVLKWGWEYAKTYDILVSNDAVKWDLVYSETVGKNTSNYSGKLDQIILQPVKARYVKLDCKSRPFPYGMFNIDKNTPAITKAAFKFTDFYFWLVHQYSTSLNDYPYATANGFNFWTIQNGQTSSDKEPYWLGLSALIWGYVLWGIISVFSIALLAIKRKSAMALYYAGYLLTSGIFVFATKMHERYLLPAIVFAMVTILWDKRMVIPTVLVTTCSLINHWYVYLKGNNDDPWVPQQDSLASAVAWITLLVMIASIGYGIWLTVRQDKVKELKKAGSLNRGR